MLHPFQAVRVAAWVPIIGTLYYLRIFFSQITAFPLEASSTVTQIAKSIWSDYNYLFLTILFLRYFRLAVNMFALYFLSKPDESPVNPTVTCDMAHVIIPSVEPTNEDFSRCVLSVLEKRPGWITIVTATREQSAQAQQVLDTLPAQNHTQLAVTTGPMANKRHQLAHVLRGLAANCDANQDVLVVFVDDHVWWPSAHFLSAVLAPFENPQTGIVAMHKQPERNRGNSFADSLLNFIACLYLERHNFEIGASNAIDGSAFVVSGRTCVIRASIAMQDDFINGFVNEYFFFGKYGPLNPDDDNYITRYIVRNGWNIKWQNQPEALMETSLGVTGGYKKFYGQINRWARSQWRSNPCSVFTDRSIWRRGYLWGASFFCVSFFNFALIWDSLIVLSWYRSSFVNFTGYHLALLILGSKFVKVAPFFLRNPQDIWMFPFQVLFAYLHSFVKFWALLTFWDHSWSGRNLAAINVQAAQDNDDHDDNDRQPRRRSSRSSSTTQSQGSSTRSHAVSSEADSAVWSNSGEYHDNTPRVLTRRRFTPPNQRSVHSDVATPWGYANLFNRHLTPANVREGQYGLRNNANFHGTPRTFARPSSEARDKNVTIGVRADSTGYLADNEFTRGRSLSRDEDLGPVSQYPREILTHKQSSPLQSSNTDYIGPANGYSTPPRTHFGTPVPAAPTRNSIVFVKDSPFPPSPTPTGRVTLQRPVAKGAKELMISRDYPRGDDCHRTHPDGTYLSARRPSSGRRRCRSPEPTFRPVITGRPRF